MFFMYDEHGGYYDHVPPPAAVAPDDIAPRITVPPDQPGALRPLRHAGAGVRDLAVRQGATTCRTWCTTTRRCCKFIETKWNLGALTYRDANADNLLDCFDFDDRGVPRAADARGARPPVHRQHLLGGGPAADRAGGGADFDDDLDSTSVVSTTTLLNMASSLPASEPTQPRFGSKTGDGVPTELAKTGSPLDRLATAGGLAALGGLAVVLAAQEKAHRAAETPDTPDA